MLNVPTIVGLIVSWAAGWLWKNHSDWANKAIPVMTFIISLITQIVAALTQAQPPVPTHAFSPAVLPLLVGSIHLGGLLDVVLKAVIQWALATGAHSGAKNVVELVRLPGDPTRPTTS